MTTSINLLENGAFDNGTHYEIDENGIEIPQVQIADGWYPWWHTSDTRPEFVVDPRDAARRVRSGTHCQHWFNSYATHTAGIYQRVNGDGVWAIGDTLIAHAYVQAWSRDDFGTGDPDNPSESNGRYRLKVGIDPYGGIDPESPDIVWSVTVQPYDEYTEVNVTVEVASDRATVFLWGQPEWACKHNNAYVEDVQLVAVANGQPPANPPNPPATDLDRLATVVAIKTEAYVMRGLAFALRTLASVIDTVYDGRP